MIMPLLMMLIFASVALLVSVSVTEEVESLGAKLITGFFFFLSLYCMPLMMKLVLLLALMAIHQKLYHSSQIYLN